MTSSTSCSTMRTDTPWSLAMRRRVLSNSTVSVESSPEEGSSRSRTVGDVARARPSSTRRETPSGRPTARRLATWARPSDSIRSSTTAFSSGSTDRRLPRVKRSDQILRLAARVRWASTRCWRTVRPAKISGCWKVRASPSSARRCGDAVVTSVPSRWTSPWKGRTKPERTPNRVLLPAPLGPTRPTSSRGWTSTPTASTASSPPYRTVTPVQDRRGTPAVLPVSGVMTAPRAPTTGR